MSDAPKINNILPPKSSIPKPSPAWHDIFKYFRTFDFENNVSSWTLGSRILGAKCCRFFGVPLIGLLCSTCVGRNFWDLERSLESCKKPWKMRNFDEKNWKWLFSILRLGGQNRLPEGWWGTAQLCVGKFFSSNQSKITQKEISDQAHPHHRKQCPRNPRKLRFSDSRPRMQQMHGRNFCVEGSRNFWHYRGTLQHLIIADADS